MAAKNTFVPFLPAGGLPDGKASAGGQFTPLSPKSQSGAEPRISPGAQPHSHGDSKVTVKKEGDVVTHILVECACGLVTEVRCVY